MQQFGPFSRPLMALTWRKPGSCFPQNCRPSKFQGMAELLPAGLIQRAGRVLPMAGPPEAGSAAKGHLPAISHPMQVQYTAYIPIIVGAEDYITLQTSMRGQGSQRDDLDLTDWLKPKPTGGRL
ncbi:unnamed protein product [Durusdinium trenchii]|uniref:Uncharacterized protein n=1 Tax=Durusdinium trenchii TaxID=1381693 RepID=A0ABP0KH05_9DINO